MSKVFIEESTLTAIGDAIRDKEGSTALIAPLDMATKITNLSTGVEPVIEFLDVTKNGEYYAPEGVHGFNPVFIDVPEVEAELGPITITENGTYKAGDYELDGFKKVFVEVPTGGGDIPEEAFTITGDCSYRFAHGGFDWFINNYGNRIKTENLSNADHMFYNMNTVEEIPFTLNFATYTTIPMSYMFSKIISNHPLKRTPAMSNCKPSDMSNLFQSAYWLEEVTEDFVNGIDWSYMDSQTGSSSCKRQYTFSYCHSLRRVPDEFLRHGNPNLNTTYSLFSYGFNNCYCLDELNLGLFYTAAWTKNAFTGTFDNCFRLKSVIFDLQEDGSPKVMQWKSQTIDLTTAGFGSASYETKMLTYGAATGITSDKKIADDASYQALKNDPNCYAVSSKYSRYNRNSAINTINTLPDCSAYGTNIIKFKGDAGELTDGGAINTLTEEEIAVATAKGWTVTFV